MVPGRPLGLPSAICIKFRRVHLSHLRTLRTSTNKSFTPQLTPRASLGLHKSGIDSTHDNFKYGPISYRYTVSRCSVKRVGRTRRNLAPTTHVRPTPTTCARHRPSVRVNSCHILCVTHVHITNNAQRVVHTTLERSDKTTTKLNSAFQALCSFENATCVHMSSGIASVQTPQYTCPRVPRAHRQLRDCGTE